MANAQGMLIDSLGWIQDDKNNGTTPGNPYQESFYLAKIITTEFYLLPSLKIVHPHTGICFVLV